MTLAEIDQMFADWSKLSEFEKLERRRSVVVDQVVNSMAMENEPVSDQWISEARKRQAVGF